VPAEPLIADAHNDLLIELVIRRHEQAPFARHWLPPLRAGGVRLQISPIYSDVEPPRDTVLRRALAQIAAFQRILSENPGVTRWIRAAGDVTPLSEDERIGLLLSIEGAEPWETDDDLADDFWDMGVRLAGLTWNFRNVYADGVAEPASGGLSARGVRLVERLVERGMILDLAHASEQTFRDVLEVSGDSPVFCSHANCRTICDSPRNLSDRQMEALAARGGVLGLMAIPFVVDPDDPSIERFVDHIEHAVAVMGIDKVVLGGDFFAQIGRAGTPLPMAADGKVPDSSYGEIAGLAGPEQYPALVEVLRRRGFEGANLDAILHGNLVRFLQESLPA
jgi:membrane dipeptidase